MCSYDVWSNGEIENVLVSVLIPNGQLLVLDVNREDTLFNIKEDVFEEAQKQPLYGVLHDMESYIFTCVNLSTGKQEEILDEERTIGEVQPFLALLRLIPKETGKAENQLISQIGILIGKGLHEFDTLKNPEVNDFRWRMRKSCEEREQERQQFVWFDKVRYVCPERVERSSKLPKYILNKLTNDSITIELRFEHKKLCQPFTINYKQSAQDAITLAIRIMNSKETKCSNEFVLKVCGQEEYLLGVEPLIQYKYVREMIASNKLPSFVVVGIDSLPIPTENDYCKIDDLARTRTMSGTLSNLSPKKKTSILVSTSIYSKFTIKVNSVKRVNCSDGTNIGVKLGVYHGVESLCELKNSSEVPASSEKASWEESISFDIDVCDIPRMAHLCIALYERKGSKISLIAWANATIFDYKSILRTGTVSLSMWACPNGVDNVNLVHPLGTVFTNPFLEDATSLTITFEKVSESDAYITYPHCESPRGGNLELIPEEEQGRPRSSSARMSRGASKNYLEQLKQINIKPFLRHLLCISNFFSYYLHGKLF